MTKFNCSGQGLTTLVGVVQEGTTVLDCSWNQLKDLTGCPDSVQTLDC